MPHKQNFEQHWQTECEINFRFTDLMKSNTGLMGQNKQLLYVIYYVYNYINKLKLFSNFYLTNTLVYRGHPQDQQ